MDDANQRGFSAYCSVRIMLVLCLIGCITDYIITMHEEAFYLSTSQNIK